MKRAIRSICLLILLFSVQVYGATWYVYYNGNGNGTAWNNSLSTIQAAINAAASGDDILVAYGSDDQSYTYSISSHLEINDKNLRITSASYNNDNSYSSAQHDSSKVIISASGTNRLFYIHGNGVTNSTVIRGFKLTNGDATNAGRIGGAVYCTGGADPTISNCWITDNTAATAGDGSGGGIGSEDVSPVVTYNLIENNVARSGNDYSTGKGGGVWIQGGSATISNNTIKNNIGRDGNSGEGEGGGIGAYNCTTTISSNTISNNTASTSPGRGYGGGISIKGNNAHTVSNNTIENNIANSGYAEGWGGGVYVSSSYNSWGDPGQTVTVGSNVFYNNTASTNSNSGADNNYGGGLHAERSELTARNNIFNHNTVLSASDDAGNRAWGGGICVPGGSTLENNTFYANADISFSGGTNGKGAGCFTYASPSSFKNNLFVNQNSTVRPNSGGVAIDTDQNSFAISFCGFYNNGSNWGDASDGGSNVTSNPQFTDADNADFTLQYNSPCIEAGNGDYSYDESSNHDYGWKYDIGAEEYSGTRSAVTVSGTGTILLGGKVRAKVNVTTRGSLSDLDVTVHENESHPDASSSVKRWYSITATGSGATVDLTLSYKDSELNGETEGSLKFYRRNGSSWEGPKSISSSSPGDNWLSATGQTSFSDWIITDAESDQSLPVDLLQFKATVSPGGVLLDWTTASEIDNLGFIIERKTAKKSWTPLASFDDTKGLKGQGSVIGETIYVYSDHAVLPGQSYSYRLIDVNYEGRQTIHSDWEVTVKMQDQKPQTPASLYLAQNYPNPFNPTTMIRYRTLEEGRIKLVIHDLQGHEIAVLVSSDQMPGIHEIAFNAAELPSGLYFYTLISTDTKLTRKLMLVK